MRSAVKRLAGLTLGALTLGFLLAGDPSPVSGAPKRDGKKPTVGAKSTKRSPGVVAPKPIPLAALPVWVPPEVRRVEGPVEKVSISLPNASAMASLLVIPVGTRDEGPGEGGTLAQLTAQMPNTSLSRAVARRDEVVVGIGDPKRGAPAWMASTDALLEALVFQGLPAYAHDATASALPRAAMIAKLREATPRSLCVAGPRVEAPDSLSFTKTSKVRSPPRLVLPEQTNQRALEVIDAVTRSLRLGWAVAPRDTELGLHALALSLLETRIRTRLVDADPTTRVHLDRREGPSLASLSVMLPPEADTKRFRERLFRELADLAKTGPSERELHAAKTKAIEALSDTFASGESACFAVVVERRDPARELGVIETADARTLRLLFSGALGPQRRSVVTVWSGVDQRRPKQTAGTTSAGAPRNVKDAAGTTKEPPRAQTKKDASPKAPTTKKTGAKRKP